MSLNSIIDYYINKIIISYIKIVKNNQNNWLWFNTICGLIVGTCLHFYTYAFVGGNWSIIYGFIHHLTYLQILVGFTTSCILGCLILINNIMIKDYVRNF